MEKKRVSDVTKAEAYIFGQMLRILQKYTRKNVLLNDRAYFFENWSTYNLLAMQNGLSDFDSEYLTRKICYLDGSEGHEFAGMLNDEQYMCFMMGYTVGYSMSVSDIVSRITNKTQVEIAEAVGVSRSTLLRWINGQGKPSGAQLADLDNLRLSCIYECK